MSIHDNATLTHACPFCGADRGQPCRTRRGRGRETDWPHSRRIALTREPVETPQYQALCCECGNLRTYRVMRNRRGWFGGDPDWNREIGDLKCDECGRVTTHATVSARGHDDRSELIARGLLDDEGWTREERLRYANLYRQGSLPRNPYLRHWRNNDDAQRAWDSGERAVTALCGETITVNRDPREAAGRTVPMSEYVEPDDDHDVEYEDPDTGLWWVDMDCVDCLRITNANRLKHQRRELLSALLEVGAMVKHMDAVQVTELRDHVERLMSDIGGTDSV